MLNRRTLLGMTGLAALGSLAANASEEKPEVVYKCNIQTFRQQITLEALVESHRLQIFELLKRYPNIKMIYNYNNEVIVVFDWEHINPFQVGHNYTIQWNPKWGDIQVFTILLEKCFNCQMERK